LKGMVSDAIVQLEITIASETMPFKVFLS
jgi:hypothetical protein